MDANLIELINKTPFLSVGDKGFLIDKLASMSALEKLKLRASLLAGQAPPILQFLQTIRAKFMASEEPKKENIITKITSIFDSKTKKIVAGSILSKPQILGTAAPQAIINERVKPLESLEEFYHPAQLSSLHSNHINFGLAANAEQNIQNFFEKTTQVFNQIESVNIKRGYFMGFLQSNLFTSYINTGLTALRHPELQPPEIILNLLFQINPVYLNNKQFHYCAKISHHLRDLCGL